MSIALAGSGIGGTIITPILNRIIMNQGYSKAFLIFGILMVVVEVPVAFFIMSQSHRIWDLSLTVQIQGQKQLREK